MTRNDYVVVAEAIGDAEDDETKRLIAFRISSALKKEYPNFNEEKFLAACGVPL
jgi:hypothetical protein